MIQNHSAVNDTSFLIFFFQKLLLADKYYSRTMALYLVHFSELNHHPHRQYILFTMTSPIYLIPIRHPFLLFRLRFPPVSCTPPVPFFHSYCNPLVPKPYCPAPFLYLFCSLLSNFCNLALPFLHPTFIPVIVVVVVSVVVFVRKR